MFGNEFSIAVIYKADTGRIHPFHRLADFLNFFNRQRITHTISTGALLGEVYYARAHALRRRGVPTWGVFLNESRAAGR